MDPSIIMMISKYSYLAIYFILALGMVGAPLPDETFLLFLGYLSSIGVLNPFMTAITAFLGSITGVSISYTVGRLIGRRFLTYIGRLAGLTEKRMLSMENLFNKYGRFAIPISYFVPGVRHAMALTCGVSKMDFSSFALFAYPGGLVWVSLSITAGFILGRNFGSLLELIGGWGLAGITAVALVLFYVIWIKAVKPRVIA